LNYRIRYHCCTHIGKVRGINQDNFICGGSHLDEEQGGVDLPLSGVLSPEPPVLVGVFDGMGGEALGEVASRLAAERAAGTVIGAQPVSDLLRFCAEANGDICRYAAENSVRSMGSTAVLLAFSPEEIAMCNIGDSKAFRFSRGVLEQISVDHYAIALFGKKPPLSQSLGIPPEEMVIEPYTSVFPCRGGDIFLLCSDGLTDMVSPEDIRTILTGNSLDDAAEQLLAAALDCGGVDNITILLCQVEPTRKSFFRRLFRP